MILCAITSRVLLADSEPERADGLVALSAKWADAGLDFLQVRERDLAEADLLQLATRIVGAVRSSGSITRVLVNGSAATTCGVAVTAGADGVHLPGGLDPARLAAAVTQVREDWKRQRGPGNDPAIGVSCHTVEEVIAARAAGATLALFAPVFEKPLPGAPALPGRGLDSLAQACAAARQPAQRPELPVLALGGVTIENAADCAAVGAAGIAAVRLFLDSGDGQAWRRLLRPEGSGQIPVPPQR